MPGRKFVSGEDYRFGFNGKEDDRDWGTQNIQDYGFRLYNPSIGKFLSVDPLSPDYPWYTPYQFAGNKPIWAVDLDGLEESMATLAQQRAQEAYLRQEISENELRDVYEAQALGAAAGGTIVAAGYAAVVAAPRMIMWGMRNPFVIKEVGAFGYGLLDQTGTDVPATVGDDLGHIVRSLSELNQSSGVLRSASDALRTHANKLLATTSKRKMPYMISAVVDKKTAKVYIGQNKTIKSLDEVHPELKKRLPEVSKEEWDNTANCAECDAFNQALNDGAKWEDLGDMHTLRYNRTANDYEDYKRCANCLETFKDKKPTSE